MVTLPVKREPGRAVILVIPPKETGDAPRRSGAPPAEGAVDKLDKSRELPLPKSGFETRRHLYRDYLPYVKVHSFFPLCGHGLRCAGAFSFPVSSAPLVTW